MRIQTKMTVAWLSAVALIGGLAAWMAPANAATPAPFACTSTAGVLTPATAVISHVGRVSVVSVGRTSTGAMGTPPLTNTGKHEMAWYNGSSRPGTGSGGVATDVHTWPDGTALGNQLLRSLVPGDIVELVGAAGARHVCYRVTARQVYSSTNLPMYRILHGTGHGQILSIVACSGRRLGPGNWSQRTLWTAQAIPPPAPRPTPTPTPTPSPTGGGLLGGLGGLLGGL